MKTLVYDILVEFLLRCIHEDCQKEQLFTTAGNTLKLGDVIMPSPGYGHRFGRCCKCGRAGLRVIKRSDTQ